MGKKMELFLDVKCGYVMHYLLLVELECTSLLVESDPVLQLVGDSLLELSCLPSGFPM